MLQWDFCTLFKEDNQKARILKKEILEEGIETLNNFKIDSKSRVRIKESRNIKVLSKVGNAELLYDVE